MKNALTRVMQMVLAIAVLTAASGCGEKPPEEGGATGAPSGGTSSGCNWYAGGRLNIGEQRCYNGQLYRCTASGLQGMGMGGSHPDCR